MSGTSDDDRRFGVLGIGVAACVACCAGPLLAFFGGLGLAGIASTWFVGIGGLALASVAGLAYLAVRRRQRRTACRTGTDEPVGIELVTKEGR
jgi:hypothetical protein